MLSDWWCPRSKMNGRRRRYSPFSWSRARLREIRSTTTVQLIAVRTLFRHLLPVRSRKYAMWLLERLRRSPVEQ